ncbi:protein kinase [Flammeovirga yaeyamensis]|uniref:Protein kinase n=1 Tax=Flammeovirga yaeyamensis TaxID=367791 RepID=A0AAX1N520_9BACT|nr:serine/threonine-protein kinase [Flammeovirga yaeyamensis]MBB3700534.1 tRNA A-37 threonylcarbamoyl transferase component Bud32 [Flammeovirga yaeyamensis]NMF36845.1 serine/threonine protein kinase [Flammeovirga yaeyamensis]QWG02605.1 protein kinase [Flammeovirga yaeyamensis]
MSDDLHLKATELFSQVMELPKKEAIKYIKNQTEEDTALRDYTLKLYLSFVQEQENFGDVEQEEATVETSPLLQKEITEKTIQKTKTRFPIKDKKTWLIVSVIAFIILLGYVYGTIIRNKLISNETREHVAFLTAQESILNHWIKSEKLKVQDLSTAPTVIDIAQELQTLYEKNGDTYFTSDDRKLAELTQRLKKISQREQLLGMSIIQAKSPITLISTGLLDEEGDISILTGEMLAEGAYRNYLKVIKGETVFVPPMELSDQVFSLENELDQYTAECHFATPIMVNNQLIGVLTMSLSADKTFSELFQNALHEQSTNVYAFNRSGIVLSSTWKDQSKGIFNDPLTIKLKYNNQTTALLDGVEEDLEKDSPQNQGQILAGYADYLGDEVVGAWKWFPDLNIGLIYERNKGEFYQSVHLFDVTFLLAVVLIIVFGVIIIRSDMQLNLLNKKISKLQQLGQYQLVEKIGEGGFGEVYKGEHQLLKQPVAVKLLKKELNGTDALDRFKKEVMVTASLNHPNTIKVYDYGHNNKHQFYYVMEYLEGISLENLLYHNKEISVGRGVYILLQVSYSLKEAHQKGLLHRDIKPANIMVCNQGGACDTIKLLDFGLVKDQNTTMSQQTKINRIGGTPMFMAPERLHDPFNADVRQDIYALGAVGLYMFSGKYIVELISQKMLQGEDSIQSLLQDDIFERKDIPSELIHLFFRSVSFNVSERPSDVDTFIDALKSIAERYPWTADDAYKEWKKFDAYG